MTFHNFTDGDVLYAAQLNELRTNLVATNRGTIPDNSDMNDIQGRENVGGYRLMADAASRGIINAPPTNQPALVLMFQSATFSTATQLVVTPDEFFFRKATSQGVWDNEWHELAHTDDLQGASQAILSLARRDGWTAVYDPTNARTVDVDGAGAITTLRDGLNNKPSLVSQGTAPAMQEGAFGQLAGFSSGVLARPSGMALSQPVTYLALYQADKYPNGGDHNLIGGGHRVWSRMQSGTPGLITNGGFNSNTPIRCDTSPHLLRMSFDGSDGNSTVSIDGQFEAANRGASGTSSLWLGAHTNGVNPWEGLIGPVLIIEGDIDEDKITRMSNLLMSLARIQPSPTLDYSTVAYSEDAFGRPTFIHGHPDAINTGPTVASITKVMTLWVARKYLSDTDMLETTTIDPADDRSTPRFEVGDEVRFQDLFYATAMPSDNTAPNAIARAVGQVILDDEEGTGDPRARFIQAMNDEADSLGWSDAHFPNPQFGALASPRMLVELFRLSMQDPVLRESHKLGEQTITVTPEGGGTRTETFTHSATSSSPFNLPGVTAAKTGTNYGFGHLVTAWNHPDGTEHYSVILNASSAVTSHRYRELRKMIDHVASGGSYSAQGVGHTG